MVPFAAIKALLIALEKLLSDVLLEYQFALGSMIFVLAGNENMLFKLQVHCDMMNEK